MLTVKIISGTYGHKVGKHIEPKDRMSKPFELADSEAKRLVALGIAEIITKEVATGNNNESNSSSGKNPNSGENGSKGENKGGNNIVGHLDADQLKEMTNKDLKALADKMGIDTSKMKVKNDFIQAIVAVEVSVTDDDENSSKDDEDGIEDGDNPPPISPEAPVV